MKFHEKSAKHIKCVDRQNLIDNPASSSLAKSARKAEEKNAEVYEKLFNTAYYIAKEGEAFRKFPNLVGLMKKNGVDVGSNYINEKACREFCISAADVLKENTAEQVQNARFICLLADGSTDKSITEQEIVYVRYVDSAGQL